MSETFVKPSHALFVYGTLMRGRNHPMARRLRSQSDLLGRGWIAAKLYSLGSYPGAVPAAGPASRVYGEALRLRAPAATLAWIDAYEGCAPGQPDPQDYARVVVPVTLNSGDKLNAWVYFYQLPIGAARPLANGRFVQR
jgi:gamma-glutamylcyclotransferase (GGCT)/AIG2-like uncharacterized protein YtfP